MIAMVESKHLPGWARTLYNEPTCAWLGQIIGIADKEWLFDDETMRCMQAQLVGEYLERMNDGDTV
jgi:hypothetical protein